MINKPQYHKTKIYLGYLFDYKVVNAVHLYAHPDGGFYTNNYSFLYQVDFSQILD